LKLIFTIIKFSFQGALFPKKKGLISVMLPRDNLKTAHKILPHNYLKENKGKT
jgi:hypothetical protein